jgi:small subunit ribosomal protein S6
MRYYETLYIVNPSFEKERLNKIIETINGEFDKNKVKVINHYVWGKKRLAYPILNHKYGTYIMIHFESVERQFLMNLGMFLKLNTSVMRHQTVRLDKQPDVVEPHEIMVENEMSESDKTINEQEVSIEEKLLLDNANTKNEENTEKSEHDSKESPEENLQEETDGESIKSVQQEEI